MISIIIPVYNGEKTILNTVNSILDQDYQQFEIIIVDDGSTDNTSRVIDSIKDDRIITLKQENARQGAARNKGLNFAKGEFVIFVDADDTISPNLLTNIDQEAKLNPKLEIIYYDMLRTYNDGVQKTIEFDQSLVHKVEQQDPSKIIASATPCNAAFSKAYLLANNIKFLEQVYFEDISYMVDTLKNAKTISYIPNCFYNYNIMENSTVRSNDAKVNLDVIKNFEYLLKSEKLTDSYQVELQFLAIKYILFEASLRTLDTQTKKVERNQVFNDLSSFYRDYFTNPNKNTYYKKESPIFKFVVWSSYHSYKSPLLFINFLRRVLK